MRAVSAYVFNLTKSFENKFHSIDCFRLESRSTLNILIYFLFRLPVFVGESSLVPHNENWSQRNNNDPLEGIKSLTIKMNSNKLFVAFEISIFFSFFRLSDCQSFCMYVCAFMLSFSDNCNTAWYANFMHNSFNCRKCWDCWIWEHQYIYQIFACTVFTLSTDFTSSHCKYNTYKYYHLFDGNGDNLTIRSHCIVLLLFSYSVCTQILSWICREIVTFHICSSLSFSQNDRLSDDQHIQL